MADTPTEQMRKIIRLLEGDVVDFPSRQPEKPKAEVPDDLRYAAALHQQRVDQGTAPEARNLGDLARPIILRNLDKIFSEQPLPPEDRAELAKILRLDSALKGFLRDDLVRKVVDIYRKANPDLKIYVSQPDHREAYLRDNPTLAKHRLEIRRKGQPPEITTFESKGALDLYVLKTLTSDAISWDDDDKDKLRRAIEHLEGEAAHPDIFAVKDDDLTPPEFDPNQRGTNWEGKPREDELLPRIEKFLNRFEYGHNLNRNAYWGISTSLGIDYYGRGQAEPISIQFNNRHARPRKIIFQSIPELEQWVDEHAREIEQWAAEQEADTVPDQEPVIRQCVDEILEIYRMILAGEPDEQALKAKIDHADESIEYIKDPEMRRFLSSTALFNATHPNMRKFIDPYHLEWLPEMIDRMLRGEA